MDGEDFFVEEEKEEEEEEEEEEEVEVVEVEVEEVVDVASSSLGVLVVLFAALGISISSNPLANPKSHILNLQSSVNNMLPGFISR